MTIDLPVVPARVGKLKIIKRGVVPSPMMWQRWHNSYVRTDIDVRWLGKCITCSRNLYASTSGGDDPRGPLGDNTLSGIDDLDVRVCAVCANEYDQYKRAQDIIAATGVAACAPIAWPPIDASDDAEENWQTYRVVRKFESDDYDDEIIETGLTKDEAMAHCRDPQTSSSTATDTDKVALTAERGNWFDGWTSE